MFGPGAVVGWPGCNIKSKKQSLTESDLETLGGGKGGFEVLWESLDSFGICLGF